MAGNKDTDALVVMVMEEAAQIAEACNQVVVRGSKLLRFGQDAIAPGGGRTHAELIALRLGRLAEIMTDLAERGIIDVRDVAEGEARQRSEMQRKQKPMDDADIITAIWGNTARKETPVPHIRRYFDSLSASMDYVESKPAPMADQPIHPLMALDAAQADWKKEHLND